MQRAAQLLRMALRSSSQASNPLSGPSTNLRWATLSSSAPSTTEPSSSQEEHENLISITFIDKDGKKVYVQAQLGKHVLDIAQANDIDLEGACEGSLACSTCHVIVQDKEYFKRIPEPKEDELDMLDMAFGLTDLSRLGCQVVATKEIDGITLAIPNPAAAKQPS